jgi:hypothetical protein
MTTTNRRTGRPLLARIFSLEGAMAAFGGYSLGAGLWYGEVIWIFWGGSILAGLTLLTLVRRRDWGKHWEELAAAAEGPRRQPEAPSDSSPREH